MCIKTVKMTQKCEKTQGEANGYTKASGMEENNDSSLLDLTIRLANSPSSPNDPIRPVTT